MSAAVSTTSGRRFSVASPALAVVALVILAAVVRVLALSINRVVWGDEPFYLWLGRNWLTGQGYTFTGYPDVHHTPLLPLLSGLLYLATGSMQTASDILYVIFGALLVVPIYLIGHEMYSHRVGLIAGLLLSIWPAVAVSVLYWGTMTEPMYYFFIYAGTCCGLLALRRCNWWAYLLAGVSFALAYLTRPEAIGYLLALAGFIAMVRLFERRLFTRRTVAGVVGIFLGFALLFLPYLWYVHGITGEWMVSEKAGVTYVLGKSLAYGDTAEFDRLTWGLDSTGKEVYFFSTESYVASMAEDIISDPGGFANLVYVNTRRFVNSLLTVRLFPYWFLLLVALGWLKRPWTRERLKAELYLLAALSPILVFLAFFIQDRYIAAIIPGLIVWLANGVSEVQDWLAATAENLWPRLQQKSAVRGLLALLPVLLVVAYLAYIAPRAIAGAQTGSFRVEQRTVGEWMRANLPAGGTVMSRYPTIAFYADKRWVPTPNAAVADALGYARGKDATYWVIDERETVKMRPQFAALLAAQPIANLVPVHVDTSSAEKLVVYRIVEATAP